MSDIDKYFPIKKDGAPSYRPYQKEKMVEILDSFDMGHKFVGVEGPVGCGKSVMNYTVARCVGNSATYITSTKILQDQLGSEKWDDLRVLKGKRSYLCNNNILGDEVFCYDDSGMHTTCENCTAADIDVKPLNRKNFITAMRGIWGRMKFRSCFSDEHNFNDIMNREVIPAVYKQCNEERSLPVEEKTIILDDYNSDPSIVIEQYILKKITCKLTNRECYHRSSRFLTSLCGVKVVNPEVMYYYNRFMGKASPFYKSDLLIIDECHSFDSVIQRIFNKKLVVDILLNEFGINIKALYTNDLEHNIPTRIEMLDICEIMYKTKFMSIINSLKYIRKILIPLMVHNKQTMAIVESNSEVYEEFVKCFGSMYQWEGSIRFFDILKGKYPQYQSRLDEFNSYMKKKFGLEFNNIIIETINYVEKYLEKRIDKMVKDVTTDYYRRKKISFSKNDYISRDYVVAANMMNLYSMLESFFDTFDTLDPGKKTFILFYQRLKTGVAVKDTPYEKVSFDMEYCDVISIVVVNTGKVINQFFYSHAEKVLMSSGSWIFPKTQKKKLGVTGLELIKVPSLFKARNRPIYVIRDLYNFSSKHKDLNDKTVYDYLISPKQYVDILEIIIRRIKGLFMRNPILGGKCKNPNILIHCYKDQIVEDIAENLHNTDKYWIDLKKRIENKNTKKVVVPRRKDSILSEIDQNADNGIIILSSSMNEGVDFKNGRARVQIILKHPTPNINDPYIYMMTNGDEDFGIEADEDFVDHVSFTTLSQQYGRIVRSEEDWGLTFLFDAFSEYRLNKYIANQSRIDRMTANFFFEAIVGKSPCPRRFDYHQVFDVASVFKEIAANIDEKILQSQCT